MSNRHESPVAYNADGREYYRLPPTLDRDDPAFETARQRCADGTPPPDEPVDEPAEVDNRHRTRAAVVAAVTAERQAPARKLSTRGELCQSCGDPLYACPGTRRVFTRCCPLCTHWTGADVDYIATRPGLRTGAA